MHTDNLQWVDDEWKAELKATLKPNENQEALAEMSVSYTHLTLPTKA